MRRGICRLSFLIVLWGLLSISSCIRELTEFDILDIPCEPRLEIPGNLFSVDLGENLRIYAPAESIELHDGDQSLQQIIIRETGKFNISIGYCHGMAVPDSIENCMNFDLHLDGQPSLTLPLTYNPNPMTAHPIFNTPFVELVCQDSEGIAALIWKDPELTSGDSVEFDLFLNLDKSTTLFRAGSGIAEDEAAFQEVKNIVYTISKK